MTRDVLDIINRKLRELEQTILYLKQTSDDININNLKDDMIRYWGIERGIQISIESVIDIANVIISSSDKEKPDTYRETMGILAELNIVPKDFAGRLSSMVGFRNILVHDYTKVKPEIIVEIIKSDFKDFIEFIVYVNSWIESIKG